MGWLNLVSNPMQSIFYLLAPTATIAAIFISSITPVPASEVVLTSMFNSVVVQHSYSNPSQQLESAPPPLDNGAPRDRSGAGTRAVELPCVAARRSLVSRVGSVIKPQ
ncbi:hypothetical protein [Allocoleopsis franciscana]|uniref:Uncharacterized protein n=1 Tax=Allocoleopsis franciscana PCC 7113 TaxID=1173027 RepID=K9WPV8_9CYAN|nr:hypothetical protein [Allocoleopsis franciscana]AFZ22213.1 hypothetical protein Mic7113_6646 [Allocoleopsis franciscana PCC 7113]